jgi:long-chain fatty acid transport protein
VYCLCNKIKNSQSLNNQKGLKIMKRFSLINLLITSVIILLASQTILATNGYFRHGYGIKYGALAGSGSALSLSSLGAISNPAGLSFLKGSRYDVNVAYFSPSREFTVTGNPSGYPGTFGLAPGTVESESNTFFFPTLGANWMLNETMALGVIVYGNGGMNTDYPVPVFGDMSSESTGVNLEQLFAGVSYAINLGGNHSLGLTALFAYQSFEANGLAMFGAMGMSSDPTKLSGNGASTSTGFGARVGYMGRITPILSIGASYQMKMNMTDYEEYAGLYAEQGGFDIPATWNAGIAVEPTSGLTVAIDVQQIQYSDVKSIANPIDPMALAPAFPDGQGGYIPNENQIPLGADDGSGFGWTDVMAYKFGLMYEGVKDWVFMAGYSYGDNPVPESEVLFNILAPGIIQHHITFGATRTINENHEVTVSLMYAPANTVSGPNVFEAPNAQTIELKMSQFQMEIGWAFSSH